MYSIIGVSLFRRLCLLLGRMFLIDSYDFPLIIMLKVNSKPGTSKYF